MQEPGDRPVNEGDFQESLDRWLGIQPIFDDIYREREAQVAQWGAQEVPLGFGDPYYGIMAQQHREECDDAAKDGTLTLRHILLEEFYEALAEDNLKAARDEMIQVIAVGVQVVQRIDVLIAQGVVDGSSDAID